MNQKVICQFCEKPCRIEYAGITYYRCDYHGDIVVKYMYPPKYCENMDWHTLILVCKTDEYYYHAVFFYNNPEFTYKFRIDRVKMIKGKLIGEEIFHLDFHPKMTPENARDKITKYVLFS